MPTTQGLTYSDDPLPKSYPYRNIIPPSHGDYDRRGSCSRVYYTCTHMLTPLSCHKPCKVCICVTCWGDDDDGADEDGVNDIDNTRMVQNNLNNDYQLGALHSLIAEFSNTVSYSVKGKAMEAHGVYHRPVPLRNQP